MDIRTSDRAFHELWKAVQATRETATVVKVDKQMLKDLLNDHSDLSSRLGKVVPLKVAS